MYSNNKLGIVLAGGGGKGAYQIGVWKYLREIGLDKKISVISGTSVGGLNAALMATNNYEIAEKIWTTKIENSIVSLDELRIDLNPYNQFFSNFNLSDGIFDREKLANIIRDNIDFSTISDCPQKIYSTCILASNATTALLNLEDTKRKAFLLNQKDSFSIIELLLATSAIPFVFPPVYYNGMNLIDGGSPCDAQDNIPITPLYDEKCTDAIVICLTNEASQIKDIDAVYPKDEFGNTRGHFTPIKTIKIIPSSDLGDIFSGTLNFSPESVIRNIQLGYSDAKKLHKSFSQLKEKYKNIPDVRQNFSNANTTLSVSKNILGETKHMIEAQDKIVENCKHLEEISIETSTSEAITKSIQNLSDIVQNTELLVPVIGPFNAGKSTMINTILGGKKILPEAITPETSLATELHYSDNGEFVEAYTEDGLIEKYEASEKGMKELTLKSKYYSHAKLYLKNEKLKELEPLVLVDMPGFESSNSAHNKAIINYIDKGLHYIVLSPVKDGTLSKSLLRQLNEIDVMNRSFSLFISKADLDKNSDKVRESIEEIIELDFGKVPVSTIKNNDVENVRKCLSSIDPNALVYKVFKNEVSNIITSLINSLNIKISSSNLEAEIVNELHKKLEKTIKELETKEKVDIKQIENRYSGSMINNIANSVRNTLNNATDEIVGCIINGNNPESLINEIIRSALVESIKNEIGSVSDSIIIDFSDSIKDLGTSFKNLNIDENYVNNMTDFVKNKISSLIGIIDYTKYKKTFGDGGKIAVAGSVEKLLEKPVTSIISKFAGVSLGSFIPGIGPIIGIVVAFVPDVLGLFFGKNANKNRETNQREEIRQKLVSEVYPGITAKIRSELPGELSKQIQQIISVVRTQYADAIEEQKQEIQKQIEEKTATEKNKEDFIQLLKNRREELINLSTEINKW